MKIIGIDPGIAGAVAVIEILDGIDSIAPNSSTSSIFRFSAPRQRRASMRSVCATGLRATIPISPA